MRIKEVEQRTGLTAKAIRLYESKGLLKPARETENDYRDYTEEDVARLKTIAILRKLDVPVKTIKEWTDGERDMREILQKAADQNREASRENELRHRLAEDLNDILEENPDVDLGEAVEVMEPINELFLELDDILREDDEHVGTPLYATLIALGPILGTMLGIVDGAEPDTLLWGLLFSIAGGILAAFSWARYLKTPKKERRHNGCLALVIVAILLIAAVIAFWIWMSDLQLERYGIADSDIVLQRPWQLAATVFLIIELTVGALAFSPDREEMVLFQRLKKGKKYGALMLCGLLAANGIMFHGALTGISVATEEGITRYSFFDPDGTFYSYSDVEQVETGFKGKLLGIPMRWTGDFYYRITYSDGVTENWGESVTQDAEEDTWVWMYRLDEWCRSGGAEKIGSDEFSEYCDMEQFYVDILIDVVNAR